MKDRPTAIKYAEVVVSVPIRRRRGPEPSGGGSRSSSSSWETTFHYAIPCQLSEDVTVGQLVVVPFGATERQGIILAFSEKSPVAETREILSISDERPVLSFPQIELARWISRNYLVPLPLSVGLMLPPGLARRLRVTLELGPKSPVEELSEIEQSLLNLIQQKRRVSISTAKRVLGKQNGQSILNRLLRREYVAKRHQLGDSRVRPKIDRRARLVGDEDAITHERLRVGRASKQADTLCLLVESNMPSHDREWVMAQVGCKDGPLKALEERGHIAQRPEVTLTVTPGDAVEEIIRLRGSAKHLAVLDLLKREREPVWLGWVYAQTGATLKTLQELQSHNLIRLDEEEVFRNPLGGKTFVSDVAPTLTPDQETIWNIVRRSLGEQQGGKFLLHGVTGSGKTEIYLRALEAVLAGGQGAIVLVPEIALTPQTINRFASRFPGRIAVQHSGLSAGERYDQWRQIRAKRFPVVVGTRLALFAPVPNLGLIIMDEEHEATYKQDLEPRYHARDVAVHLAQLTGAALILGSATPDVLSYTRAKRAEYTLLELPQRVVTKERTDVGTQPVQESSGQPEADVAHNGLPPVEVVDMREELRAGNRSIFSRALTSAIGDALGASEQVILFLNRRGTSTFVMCRDCGAVIKCSQCDVPCTYHAREQSLQCHHCNRQTPVPGHCPLCGSKRIKFFGVGTEKVAALTEEAFPEARILRWDRDMTRSKGSHEQIMEQFVSHKADILIGTQMIAKGLDLPLVTVVGAISADTALYLPDFRAGERTFQLLTQVAGRAGRSDLGGRAFIQTYTPEHYAIRAASQHNYAMFYREEIAFRRQQSYPPYGRLARLLFVHTNQAHCRRQAESLYQSIERRIAELGLPGIALIGPAPCFLKRIKGKYRWHLVVSARDPLALLEEMTLPLGWQVDIDPVHLL
jgi:primosomal protein N' (replication factor Y)